VLPGDKDGRRNGRLSIRIVRKSSNLVTALPASNPESYCGLDAAILLKNCGSDVAWAGAGVSALDS
jgi:hypothetical protein